MTDHKRRYLVRARAESPMWSGTIFAVACKHLASAELLFEKKRADEDHSFQVLELIDKSDVNETTGALRVLRKVTRLNEATGTRH